MTSRVDGSQRQGAIREVDLLASLGLGSGASNDQIEAAHDEILDFLAEAPASLRAWAQRRVAEADEAYAELNGGPGSAAEPAASAIAQAEAMVTRAKHAKRSVDAFDGGFDGDDFDERREHRPARAKPATAPTGAITIDVATMRRGALVGGVVVAAAVFAFAIYSLGQPSVPGLNGTPAPRASGGLDTAAVAAAMQKLAANENDVATLQELADLYYAAEDYVSAQSWLQKILDIDPENVAALLGYGAAAFNQGDLTSAEAKWRAVLVTEPDNIEAHYDLGFMYFSQSPPNVEGVKTEWNAVLALDPDADLKAYIEAHLASLANLESAQPSAAPVASPSASPSAS